MKQAWPYAVIAFATGFILAMYLNVLFPWGVA